MFIHRYNLQIKYFAYVSCYAICSKLRLMQWIGAVSWLHIEILHVFLYEFLQNISLFWLLYLKSFFSGITYQMQTNFKILIYRIMKKNVRVCCSIFDVIELSFFFFYCYHDEKIFAISFGLLVIISNQFGIEDLEAFSLTT